jgi:hypothetical protein
VWLFLPDASPATTVTLATSDTATASGASTTATAAVVTTLSRCLGLYVVY